MALSSVAQWEKRGLIFSPYDHNISWMHTHAWVAVPDHLEGDLFKVYFGTRNIDNKTQPGYFIINIKTLDILEVSRDPVLTLGERGSFDDSLVGVCSIENYDGAKFLYYVGWAQGVSVRYYPTIGLAISEDGGKTFQKYSRVPILDRTHNDPFGMASPFVKYYSDEGRWRMLYASYLQWRMQADPRNGKLAPWPDYYIRYAESRDGIHWERAPEACLGSKREEAVARPWVIDENGLSKMWYSYRARGGNYLIGYAESTERDWQSWTRKDAEVGLSLSSTGWDSEALCYPAVFDHDGKRYMFYNGNTFGYDGLCLAERTLIN